MLISREMVTSPEMLGMRRLPTAATFYHFESEQASKQVKKERKPARKAFFRAGEQIM